ncbi:MAG TPA: hypothetical protein VGM19_01455 [Armatimonadota bacterium]|jgi:hypothetical protein
MSIKANILTPIEIPETVQVEVVDSIRGTLEIVEVDFHRAMRELSELGMVDLHELDPEELITMACALARHRAIDHYLVSIGIDPHAKLKSLEAEANEGG